MRRFKNKEDYFKWRGATTEDNSLKIGICNICYSVVDSLVNHCKVCGSDKKNFMFKGGKNEKDQGS